jgi:hypothetical protein
MNTPLHVADHDVVDIVNRLVEATGKTKTAIVFEALSRYAADILPPAPREEISLRTKKDVLAELDRRLRSITRDYVRMLEEKTGKRSGSRIYQMLARDGVLLALAKVVARPTEGLENLIEADRLELAFETVVLDPVFADVIPEEVRERAIRNLAMAKAAIASKKKN